MKHFLGVTLQAFEGHRDPEKPVVSDLRRVERPFVEEGGHLGWSLPLANASQGEASFPGMALKLPGMQWAQLWTHPAGSRALSSRGCGEKQDGVTSHVYCSVLFVTSLGRFGPCPSASVAWTEPAC
jgi:hypothetical protein